MNVAEQLLKEEFDRWKSAAEQEVASLKSRAQPYLNIGQSLLDPKQRSELIESIQIESQVSPPIVLSKPFVSQPPKPAPPAPPPGATSDFKKWIADTATMKNIGNLVKPKITIKVQGLDPFVAAPFGQPTAKHWETAINWGKIALLGIGVLIILRVAAKRRCVCSP